MRPRGGRPLLVAALLFAACGDDGPSALEEAELGIAGIVADRLDDGDDVVARCPEDAEVEAGAALRCDVVVGDSEPIAVDLVVTADGTLELQRAVIPTEAAEAYLASELAGPAEGPVEPDCGAAPLLVADVDDELRCEVVRTVDGAVRTVVLTVLGLDGTVRYRVEAAGTVVPPSPP